MKQETLCKIMATIGIVSAGAVPFAPNINEMLKNGEIDLSDPIPISSSVDKMETDKTELKEKYREKTPDDVENVDGNDSADIYDLLDKMEEDRDLADDLGDLAGSIKDGFDDSEKRKKQMELDAETENRFGY